MEIQVGSRFYRLENQITTTVSPVEVRAEEWIDFSTFDMFAISFGYTPLLLFYGLQKQETFPEIAESLKESLAKVLVSYYPMAGRIKSEKGKLPRLLCDASGPVFIEAYLDLGMDELLEQEFKVASLLSGMAAAKVEDNGLADFENLPSSQPALIIQVTCLKSGGFVLGVNWHHAVTDALGGVNFVRAWSQLSSGLEISPVPVHDRSALTIHDPTEPEFLPFNMFPLASPDIKLLLKQQTYVTKAFYFSEKTLTHMKEKITAQTSNIHFTVNECLCSMLWRCRARVQGLTATEDTAFAIAVDIRQRIPNRLSEGYLGNASILLWTKAVVEDLLNNPISFGAELIHSTMEKAKQSEVEEIDEELHLPPAHIPDWRRFGMSNWQHFPIYDVDFQWGPPIFATRNGTIPYLEMGAFCMPSGKGSRGVVLLVCLPGEKMAKMEADPEFCFDDSKFTKRTS
eukprot:c22650_g1_i1 orf=188-1555(+)